MQSAVHAIRYTASRTCLPSVRGHVQSHKWSMRGAPSGPKSAKSCAQAGASHVQRESVGAAWTGMHMLFPLFQPAKSCMQGGRAARAAGRSRSPGPMVVCTCKHVHAACASPTSPNHVRKQECCKRRGNGGHCRTWLYAHVRAHTGTHAFCTHVPTHAHTPAAGPRATDSPPCWGRSGTDSPSPCFAEYCVLSRRPWSLSPQQPDAPAVTAAAWQLPRSSRRCRSVGTPTGTCTVCVCVYTCMYVCVSRVC